MSDPKSKLTPEQYKRLRDLATNPYRDLRKFVYIAFGASGAIGAFVFLARLAAGRDIASTLPNLALQLGVIALMVFLFRREK
jgi:hypothetical protein